MNKFTLLFERLGFSQQNGLYITHEEEWINLFSSKIERTLLLLNPYAFFVFNQEPLILFFDETSNNPETHQNCWNFNNTPIVFFVSETDIVIHNGFKLVESSGEILLKKIVAQPNADSYKFYNIVSGELFYKLQKEFKNSERVDQQLLSNINAAKNELVGNGLDASIANSLLGRLIFIRYLIDRRVRIAFDYENDGFLTTHHFNQILVSKELLYQLFSHLRNKFEGDAFPSIEREEEHVEETHLIILHKLFSGDYLADNQLSLFNYYNFEIIPIEFISNVYEYFMGRDKQVKQKAYYTPSFLATYIVDQTVASYLSGNPQSYSCKVLDPTCGSGIFLVESLRRIVKQYEKLNGAITNQDSHILTQLAADNIFGIDKDRNAINVAIFSLYITLLDYQNPKDIENFVLPQLLDKNFFVEDFFNLDEGSLFEAQSYCAAVLKDKTFQFIIGNPPWGKVEDSPYMACIYQRQRAEGKIIGVSDEQFSQAFLVHTSIFCKPQTICAVVINSKLFYNLNADKFRYYFLTNFYVDRVFEMSAVRRYLFNQDDSGRSGAITPASVITYRYAFGNETKSNTVVHTTLKLNLFYKILRFFVVEKNDIKTLKQSNFISYDWIWKVLLYGNELDFQFIKRLRSIKNKIENEFSDETRFDIGVGVTANGSDQNPANHLIGKPYLDLKKNYLKPFSVSIPAQSKWSLSFAHRPSNERLFEPVSLLIKKAVDSHFRIKAALSTEAVVFTDNVLAIKSLTNSPDDIGKLSSLEAVLHSRLYTYFLLHSAASLGVEREKVMKKELLSFPSLNDPEISKYSTKIRQVLREIKGTPDLFSILDKGPNLFVSNEDYITLSTLYQRMNEKIEYHFDVDDLEAALIDYSLSFVIPEHSAKSLNRRSVRPDDLKDYISIFTNHFEKVFPFHKGYQITAEFEKSAYYIQVSFYIDRHSEEAPRVSGKKTIDLFANLSLSQITNRLFVNKDVKIFQSNSFHIIKPDEQKNWHSAIAYSDLSEVRSALLKSAINNTPVL